MMSFNILGHGTVSLVIIYWSCCAVVGIVGCWWCCFYPSHLYIHVWVKTIVFDRGSKGTLHGEGYSERDIAAKLRRSNTAVHNAVVKFNADGTFHDRKRSGRPQKTTSKEDLSVRQTVMRSQKNQLFYA